MNPEQIQPEAQPSVDETLVPQQQPTQAPPAQPQFDANQIAQAAATAAITAQQAIAPSVPNPNDPAYMSAEQQAEHFQTYAVTEDFTNSFVTALKPDEEGNVQIGQVSKAFEGFRDGVLAQGMRHTELALEQQQASFDERFVPMQQHMQQQQADGLWSTFATQHAHLKDYRPMVDQAAATLKAQGFQPTSQEHLFNTVAQSVGAQLQQINPALKFPVPNQQQQQPAVSGFVPQQPSPPQANAFIGMNGTAMNQGTPVTQASTPQTSEFYDAEVFG